MTLYIEKPMVVEAYQYLGATTQADRLLAWIETGTPYVEGDDDASEPVGFTFPTLGGWGVATVNPGDWVYKAPTGDFFTATDENFNTSWQEQP